MTLTPPPATATTSGSPVLRLAVPRADPPLRDHLPLGGEGITVTSRYLERDGRPIIPVSAEVHFSRMPASTWDDELRKIAASGVTVLATYAIWIHHEPTEGTVSFDGGLDLRAFLLACRAHGLDVFLRVGPWAHAEVRNGGLPDWLLARGLPVRTDDPAYLAEARRWFTAVARQIQGIPLLAVQVENELYDDAEHLATLIDMARECGIHAPLWTGTAWGGAHLPVDRMLPLYAGYSEAFWIAHDEGVDLSSASNFYYSDERDEVGVGADTRDSALEPSNLDPTRYPYATCELGGGMVAAYHRRPTAQADDVAALALTKLGSGSTWQGYYMFHDGLNPGRDLQESHATGGRNDLPSLSYDFGAPLGLFGERRPSLGKLRLQHHFLCAFGDRLAPLPLVLPDSAPEVGDTTALRWAVRGDGDQGFLFVTNHQPHVSLPEHRVQFEVAGVTFPECVVASGAYFFWPIRFPWRGRTIDWATAQIVTEVGEVLVVTADGDAQASIDGTVVALRPREVVDGILLLSRADAERAQIVGERLVLSDDILAGDRIYAETPFPVLDVCDGHGFVSLALAEGAVVPETVPVRQVREPGAPPPIVRGPLDRASAPTDYAGAGAWVIDVSALPRVDGMRLLIELEWSGDVARALVDGQPVDDRYFTGRPWMLPRDLIGDAHEVVIEILSLDPAAPIYLTDDARTRLGDGIARLRSARVHRVERRELPVLP